MATLTGGLQEDFIPTTRYNGFKTNQNVSVGGSSTIDFSGSTGQLKFPSGGASMGSAPAANGYFVTARLTNANTAVNLFGSTAGFAGSLTSIIIDPQDDTNGKIEVFSDAGTIIQITKGSIGALKGSVAGVAPLATTTFASASTIKIVSGTVAGGGNAIVIATFVTT